MRLLRKLRNLLKPLTIGYCIHCNHPSCIHRDGLIALGYPGLKCLGRKLFQISSICMCDRFEPVTNLTYLERKAEEAGMI